MSPSQGDVLKKIPDESNTPSAIELITPNTSNNPKVEVQNESSDWLTHGCARIYLVAFPYICAFNLLICISMSVFLPCPITLTVESIRHPLHQYIYVSSSNRPFKFPGWCIQIYIRPSLLCLIVISGLHLLSSFSIHVYFIDYVGCTFLKFCFQ